MRELISKLDLPWRIFAYIGVVIAIAFIAWVLTKINKYVFRRIEKRRKGLELVFFERVNVAIIIIAAFIVTVSFFSGFAAIWQTLLGGTAIISAVLAFAAQDTIRDILAGLMISIHKPFTIGDRIVLDDGTSGTVQGMNMRHVVLIGIDTQRIVVPNSVMNSQKIINYSYNRADKSILLEYSVGYDTDIQLAKKVIAEAVESSEYSKPIKRKANSDAEYAPVYFRRFAESALILSVTVFFEKNTPTELVFDDVNVKVREALIANGIEIPYNYVNVVEKDAAKEE
ncbi:MAG: mechanosensitive ion channel family protein [Clostridia bacterium]|nr:mechanosensitive ion channel family protein [Clostridia bacterium]MBR5769137.1 mechanosensitive ion channel family protein [Clostridia bacterium]MBR5942293.1 mechanosensitive ion channel family protein [Clostridia bacterium]